MNEFLSVVICTYNRADSLRTAAETVIAQDTRAGFDFELIVVDDQSTDHTRATVADLAVAAPRVRHVLNTGTKGIAGARNTGVASARGEFIIFFDDDQLAEPQWLEGLLQVVRIHKARIVGGARRLDLPEATVASLGVVARSLLGENLYGGAPQIMRGKELPTTGNLLVAREVFERVGGFDEVATGSGGEDAELIGRARAGGIDVWTAPEAMVAHMIPDYRTTEAYLRWVSRRWGVQFAQIDAKRHGKVGAIALAVARGAQAFLQRWPQSLLASTRRDAAAARNARCYLWRAEAYVRKTLALAAPALFTQRHFLDQLEFRNERQLFASESPGTPDARTAGS